MKLSEFEIEILKDCDDDYLSVWNVMRKQNRRLSTDAPISEEIIKKGFIAIENLLRMGLIDAGHLGGKFQNSSLSVDEIMKHLTEEKLKFENTPLFYGFIYWFQITEEGEKVLQEIDAIN